MTTDSLYSLLSSLKIGGLRVSGSNILGKCPNHEEDRPSWGISTNEPHLHACFACGFKGTLFSLLFGHYKWPIEQVKRFIDETKGPSKFPSLSRAKNLPIKIEAEKAYPYLLSRKAVLYLLGRGITYAVIKAAQCSYDPIDNRVLFPWILNKEVVGLTGRSLDSDEEVKTRPYFGTRKGQWLYLPYGEIVQAPLILVEGEIDSLRVASVAFSNVAALGFGKFTKEQRQLILDSGAPIVTLFFDQDDTGRRLTQEVANSLKRSVIIRVADYSFLKRPDEKIDPGSMTSKDLIRAVTEAGSNSSWPQLKLAS